MDFLTDRDFFIDQGQKGKLLCTRRTDLSLVVFHTPACPYCETAKPILAKIADRWKNVLSVRSVNLTLYPSIVEMSNYTLAPLRSVPTIILYVNGRPYVMYEGDIKEKDMFEFCEAMVQQLRAQQNMSHGMMSSQNRDEWNRTGGGGSGSSGGGGGAESGRHGGGYAEPTPTLGGMPSPPHRAVTRLYLTTSSYATRTGAISSWTRQAAGITNYNCYNSSSLVCYSFGYAYLAPQA